MIDLGFSKLYINTTWIGTDLLITVKGGSAHIGCTVLSVPRPSLSDPNEISCTSSVLNMTGHKDDIICRYLAEKAVKQYQTTVCCTGGFHIDHMTSEQVQILLRCLESFEYI